MEELWTMYYEILKLEEIRKPTVTQLEKLNTLRETYNKESDKIPFQLRPNNCILTESDKETLLKGCNNGRRLD